MARYEAKLDLSKEFEKSFSLPLFTGDSGSSVSLEFYQNGVPYDMSGAMLYARRADGVILASSGIAMGNKAELLLTNNMYVCPGELQVQISVVDVYGNFLTNGILYFTVREGFSEQAQGEGSDDYCDLTALIRKVGEGLGSIQRAETAATIIETLMNKVPNLEEQVIKHIREEETDCFVSGFAVVSTIESVDSEGGPIATEYYYPLLAESSDLFGNIEVNQIRFFKGKWERRTLGAAWSEISFGSTDTYTKAEIDSKLSSVYRYKGTVEAYTDLPDHAEIGDVYNIKNGYHLSKDVKPITVYDVYSDDTYSYAMITPGSNLPPFYFSPGGLSLIANVYDKNFNKITEVGLSDIYQIKCYNDVILEVGKEYYLEFYGVEQIDLAYETDIITVTFDINEGENVAWTGEEWDILAGTVDLSGYVTKEDIGNIETALSNIEALQNSYIGGDDV